YGRFPIHPAQAAACRPRHRRWYTDRGLLPARDQLRAGLRQPRRWVRPRCERRLLAPAGRPAAYLQGRGLGLRRLRNRQPLEPAWPSGIRSAGRPSAGTDRARRRLLVRVGGVQSLDADLSLIRRSSTPVDYRRMLSRDSQVPAVRAVPAPPASLAAVAERLDSGALPQMTAVPHGEATSSTVRPSIIRVSTSDLPRRSLAGVQPADVDPLTLRRRVGDRDYVGPGSVIHPCPER